MASSKRKNRTPKQVVRSLKDELASYTRKDITYKQLMKFIAQTAIKEGAISVQAQPVFNEHTDFNRLVAIEEGTVETYDVKDGVDQVTGLSVSL